MKTPTVSPLPGENMRGELRQFLNAAAQLGFNFAGFDGSNHRPLHNADTGTPSRWRTHHPIHGRNTASRPTTRTISPGGAISRHPSQHPVVCREPATRPRWFHNRPAALTGSQHELVLRAAHKALSRPASRFHHPFGRENVVRSVSGPDDSVRRIACLIATRRARLAVMLRYWHPWNWGHTPPPPETRLSRGITANGAQPLVASGDFTGERVRRALDHAYRGHSAVEGIGRYNTLDSVARLGVV